jgi:hypothetical protein
MCDGRKRKGKVPEGRSFGFCFGRRNDGCFFFFGPGWQQLGGLCPENCDIRYFRFTTEWPKCQDPYSTVSTTLSGPHIQNVTRLITCPLPSLTLVSISCDRQREGTCFGSESTDGRDTVSGS